MTFMAMSDESLVATIASGPAGQEAFEELVRRYEQPLLGYLSRRLPNHAEAEDCAQHTWIKIWHYASRFDPEMGTFQTWLYAVARNVFLDSCKRAKTRREVSLDAAMGHRDERDDPVGQLQAHDFARKFWAFAATLGERDRSILVAVMVDHLSYRQVAAALGCSKGTVCLRMQVLTENLKENIVDWPDYPINLEQHRPAEWELLVA